MTSSNSDCYSENSSRHSIYADYNSTSPLYDEVKEAMLPFLDREFGNPSSYYSKRGEFARSAVEKAREQVAEMLDAESSEVVFVSGGTESCYQAILGSSLWHHNRNIPLQFLCSSVEHSCVLEAISTASDFTGFKKSLIPVSKSGELNCKDLRQPFEGSVFLSLMAANNETGICYSLESCLQNLSLETAIVHSDLVQYVGKKVFSFRQSCLDLASISSHKIGGPKGIGALLIKAETPWQAPMPGGGQESGRRGGTLAVANIVGFGEAARLSKLGLERVDRTREVRDTFENALKSKLPEIEILGEGLERIPNTSSLIVDHVSAVELVKSLAGKGVCISNGSACHSSHTKVSHVLSAMGRSERESRSHLRISFGHRSCPAEAIELADVFVKEVVQQRDFALNEVNRLLGKCA